MSTHPLPRGRHGLTREQVEATQRLRLAVATAEVCADIGFAAMSVKRVLDRAGVSRLTFYELYDNKLDCFLDALDLVGAVLIEQLRIALGDSGEPNSGASDSTPRTSQARFVERPVVALDRYLDGLADNLAFARLFIVEAHAAGAEAMHRRADLQARVADGLAAGLGATDEAGRFACAAFVGAVASAVTMPIVDGDVDALRALRDPLVVELRALAARFS